VGRVKQEPHAAQWAEESGQEHITRVETDKPPKAGDSASAVRAP
jgi:hypothetical protein